MNKTKTNKLKKILDDMDIPANNKILDGQQAHRNLLWLGRNLAVRNKGHKDMKKAMTLIMDLLKEFRTDAKKKKK